MNRVDGYSAYQSNFYDKNVQQKKAKGSAKTNGADKTANKGNVQLSERAKKLLEQLRKTYKNMDIMVADYETDEEAAAYLSRGVKEYSVLIDPDELEEMAANEDVKKKNLDMLDNAIAQLKDMKDQLSGDGQTKVTRVGVTIGKDGEMSFFAELEKMSENQRERIEKAREEKQEARKAEDKGKSTRVYADSVEELLEKLKSVDWDKVKDDRKESGGKFDYTV